MSWEEDTCEVPIVEPGGTIEVATMFYGVWGIMHREANDGQGGKCVPWGNAERWEILYAPGEDLIASQTVQSSSDTLKELKRYIERLPQIVTGDIERLQEVCMEVRDEMNLDLEAA